ncbi:MlaA family lipoprotein [Sphingobium boeckii]|uniref:Phospholipid-binding lipoprotein MlaA n=1 Tax=Sphingobium boeckii TaxID=1082345 RepID=A0A7W9AFJ2_9SPHN|nr:VacJ family lipoprotein [Sphingobium boeckii]MBB5684704.1 phospholipid-binding lipoprotein MlaA [Sphingobium boeckii]
MSISALTTALLLAGASMTPVEAPPAAPVLVTVPAMSDQQDAAPVTVPQPATPLESSLPLVLPPATEPLAPPASPDTDPDEIVVVARPNISTPGDPLEAINAKSFEVTQVVDRAFVAPAASAYSKTVPAPLRSGLRNFFNNLTEPVVFLNYMLQLKPGKAAETLGRFAINTTIGAAGLFDMAKRRPFKLPRRPNGFANTLGYYGVKPGAFLFLPLIGPTTVRDFIGTGVDRLLVPMAVGAPFNQPAYSIPAGIIGSIDYRVEFDTQLRKIHEAADPYAASRANYLLNRQAEIDALRGKPRAAALPAPDPMAPAMGPLVQPPVATPVLAPPPAVAPPPVAPTIQPVQPAPQP